MRVKVIDLSWLRRLIIPMAALAVAVASVVLSCAIAFRGASVAASGNAENTDGKTVIVIDAGHGGEDPGAVSGDGVYEKNLNLEIAMLIGEELKTKGYTVVYTRTEDKMLYSEEENIKGFRKLSDLKNRCKIANSFNKAALISIHMNTFGDSRYSGLQTYYRVGDEKSRALATAVQNSVRERLQPDNDRAIKEGKNIYLLENCAGLGILIECGFMSNAEEAKKLSEKEYQKELSFSIVCAIIEYIKE